MYLQYKTKKNMLHTATPKTEKTFTASECKLAIENHKKAATHLEAAKTHHLKEVKQHEDGEHEKAKKSTLSAQEEMKLATSAHKAVAKEHGLAV